MLAPKHIQRADANLTFERPLDSEEAASLLKIHPKTLQKIVPSATRRNFRTIRRGGPPAIISSVISETLRFPASSPFDQTQPQLVAGRSPNQPKSQAASARQHSVAILSPQLPEGCRSPLN
jgi:hypothetical protein